MQKKIEIDILFFILIEAIFLLFFFKDNFLTMFLGIIFGITLLLLTKKINQNKILRIILLISSLPLCGLTFYQIICFISNNLLKNYSPFLIVLPFGFIALYLVYKKYHTFIKTMEISFYFFVFLKLISFILIIPKINFSNFTLGNSEISYHFLLIGLFIFYISKTIQYLTNYQIKTKKSIIAFINPLIIKLLTILVLSNTLFNIYNYPYFDYLKTIRYFDFIERVDGILSFEYLFCFFFLFVFLLFNIKNLYKKNQ